MDTLTPCVNGPARATASKRGSAVNRIVRAIPTLVVLVALCGASYWGHRTRWEFASKSHEAGPSSAPGPDLLRAVVRLTPSGPGSDLPLPGQQARIEFASADAVEAVGIDITPAWTAAMIEQATGAGEVGFDAARTARLSARAGGAARRVLKAAGDPVRAGEVLALIESAEVGKAKAEFQQALVQARLREKTRDDLVGAKSATSSAQIREAEAAVKEAGVRVLAAAQTLTNLGLPVNPADFRGLAPVEVAKRIRFVGVEDAPTDPDPGGRSANLLPVRAPFAGVVLSADLVAGEVIEAGKSLFVVVDPSRVWVTLHLGAEDARRVAVGQKAFFRPDGGSREHPAAVVWVGTAADENTRTVPVRAEAENAAGALRASTLGRGRIVLREEPKAVVVPHQAVQSFRGRSVVFVRDPDFLKPDGPKAFHARVVRTGGRDERNTEVLAGVSPGEIVATKGSGVLLGELTRTVADR